MTNKNSSCGLHFVEPNRAGMLVISEGMEDGGARCKRSASAEEALFQVDPMGNPEDVVAAQEAASGKPFALSGVVLQT